jgi:imidazolonepropionase-like amidohydrolase
MRVWIGSLFLLGSSLSPAVAEPAPAFVFRHVNVVPMDRNRILKDEDVIVKNRKIVGIGHGLPIPAGATQIDGHGTEYLSPGLADMHTHSDRKGDFVDYLANGVTTVLHMGGARSGFIDTLVPSINRGDLPGPRIYTGFLVDGGPDYNGFVVKTPAEGRAAVDLAKDNGYDFLKVYVDLRPEVFEAMAAESKAKSLPIVGHGIYRVRLKRQLAAGQVMIAHAEEFFYTFFTPAGAEEKDTPPDVKRIPDAVRLAKSNHATVTADLATYGAISRQIGHPEVLDAFLAAPEAQYLSPDTWLAWEFSEYGKKTARLEAKFEFLKKMVRQMADAGVELIAGTDATSVPGMFPGFSLHEDLAELLGAGLTPFQALSAATREPGQFIARTKGGVPFGEVASGYRADLLLSSANPLEDMSTLRHPLGVMANGRWYSQAELATKLDEVRSDYRRVRRSDN